MKTRSLASVYGIPESPFVRKVRVFMIAKGLKFRLVPVMPRDPSPTFRRISPFGKIPGYREGSLKLSDSSVICAYLEKKHPEPQLYPEEPEAFARALWLEELADSCLADLLTRKILYQVIVRPLFLKEKTDHAEVEKTLKEEIPPIFSMISEHLPCEDLIFGKDLSIADISIVSQLLSLKASGHEGRLKDWPKIDAYSQRVQAVPAFSQAVEAESFSKGGFFQTQGLGG